MQRLHALSLFSATFLLHFAASAQAEELQTFESDITDQKPHNATLKDPTTMQPIRILKPPSAMGRGEAACETRTKVFELVLPDGKSIDLKGKGFDKLDAKKVFGKEDEGEAKPPEPGKKKFKPIFRLKKGSAYFAIICKAENGDVRFKIRTRVGNQAVKG